MNSRGKNYTKKIIGLAAALTMAVSLSACGSSSSEAESAAVETTEAATEAVETTEAVAEDHTVPADFIQGYKQGDYAYYSDENNQEAAEGDKIWFDGIVTQTEAQYLEELGANIMFASIKDADANIWYVMMDKADAVQELRNYEENYSVNGIQAAGVYLGVGDGKPIVVLNKWISVSDGEEHISGAFGNYSDSSEQKESEAETTEAATEAPSDTGEISADFKAAMDEYEAFFDEYVDFIQNYDTSDTSQAMKYLSFLTQYAETMQSFEELGDEDMNAAEAAYYAEVSLRISEKLLKVGESLY